MASQLTGRSACWLIGGLIASLCVAACVDGASATTAIPLTSTPHAPSSYARLLNSAAASGPTSFVRVATRQGRAAEAIGRSPSGVALPSFNHLVQPRLHFATRDADGWRFLPFVAGSELCHLGAAFNVSTGSGGFTPYGRAWVPLRNALGSVLACADGGTNIGSLGSDVPARGLRVVSVRQPGESGIAGHYLAPSSRDFFTVATR